MNLLQGIDRSPQARQQPRPNEGFPPPEMAAAPDDPTVGKYLILAVALLFMGVVRLSTADFENAKIPFLSAAEAANPAAKSAEAIGTAAEVALPESDPSGWFAEAGDGEEPPWADIQQFAGAASTPAGWVQACKFVATAAGTDRTANPSLGALACSDDSTVTELQQFAVELLVARAEVALWLLGTPGHDAGMVAARLGEIRHSCENGLPARLAGAESAYPVACEMSLAAMVLPADAAALEVALGEAYALVALDLAVRDPGIDAEPAIAAGVTADTADDATDTADAGDATDATDAPADGS